MQNFIGKRKTKSPFLGIGLLGFPLPMMRLLDFDSGASGFQLFF
jgi:hypothetical protein